MGILLVIVLVSAVQDTSGAYDADLKNMARAFPVQKIIPFHRNIQILNAQKFIRALPDENTQNIKKYAGPEMYTVFPAIPTKSHRVTYFPIETLFGPSRLIRRVPHQRLLNYSRFKRSANFANVTKSKITTRHRYIRHDGDKDKKYVPNVRTNIKSKSSHKPNREVKTRGKSPHSGRTARLRANKTKVKNEKANPKTKRATLTSDKNKKVTRGIKRQQETRHRSAKKKKEPTRSLRDKHSSNKRSPSNTRERKESHRARHSARNTNQRVNDSRRLLAGKDSTIEQYPYTVSIQKRREHWCSGALLNQRLVITTANCVWKSVQVSRMTVRAGSKYSDRGGQVAGIQELMRHPGWSIRHNPDNDVALLLLDRNLKFSHHIHAVDLPNHSMMPSFNDAWVTSWGSDKRDGVYMNTGLTLQAYNAKIMDFGKCQNITQRFGVFVTRNFFCMSQIGRRSPCTRDTGAPAVSDGVLWGLASWGLRKLCGTERFPAMFTYVAADPIMNFIENSTRLLMSDERFYPYPDRIADTWLRELMTNMTKAG